MWLWYVKLGEETLLKKIYRWNKTMEDFICGLGGGGRLWP